MRSVLLVAIGALVFSAGCAEEESCSTSGTYSIPEVELTCTSNDQALECGDGTANGHAAWMILMPVNGDCNGFAFTDTYHAKTETAAVSCTGGICSAASASWTDSSGSAITSLSGGTYRLCVWIDTNDDDTIADDQNEPRTVADVSIDSCGKSIVMTGFFDF